MLTTDAMRRLTAENEQVDQDGDTTVESDGVETLTAAQRHYSRLRGIGYSDVEAQAFVNNLYKEAGASFRDLLRNKKPTPDAGFVQNSSEETSVPIPGVPTVGQKIVTSDDLGRIAFVGSRFVSIEWLNTGKRERLALRRYYDMVTQAAAAPLPSIRIAGRNHDALRAEV